MNKSVKIILLQDIPRLGQKNDIKSVKFGFAKNWLIPQKLAVLARPLMVAEIERAKTVREEVRKRETLTYEKFLKELEGFVLRMRPKKTEKGTLYAAIDAKTIAGKLKEKGIVIDPSHIQLDEGIKKVGEYDVPVRLSERFHAKIKLIVQ
ncbi:MAG: 50S ribosomal protein L9 [Candidatus Portnoybacteria bacterium]|nr:50S ribosomal protein L9 [Candidatus Portnoybacteria bacterium]